MGLFSHIRSLFVFKAPVPLMSSCLCVTEIVRMHITTQVCVGKNLSVHADSRVFQINEQVLHGRSHLNASAMIKSISTNKVKIVLLRRPQGESLTEMAVKPLKLPPIQHRVSPTDNSGWSPTGARPRPGL